MQVTNTLDKNQEYIIQALLDKIGCSCCFIGSYALYTLGLPTYK